MSEAFEEECHLPRAEDLTGLERQDLKLNRAEDSVHTYRPPQALLNLPHLHSALFLPQHTTVHGCDAL